MIIIRFLILVSFVFFSASCVKKKQFEIEPNNTFLTANVIEAGKSISAYVDSSSDQDFFMYYSKDESVLDINLSAVKGVNHSIEIWRDNGIKDLLKLTDDNRKSSAERVRNLYVEEGTYFINISHGDRDKPAGNKENSYSLIIE